MKRTWIYVDAFNLYYRALRGTRNKWLDINKLCQQKLNPDNEIQKIKYFTASIRRNPRDPRQHVRQQVYLRALRTLPNLEIIKGRFTVHTADRIVAGSSPTKPVWKKVLLPVEKGSDVNLAVHMVNDGHNGCYDLSVLITSDTDLLGAMRVVKDEIGKLVGLISPVAEVNEEFRQRSSFVKKIHKEDTRTSQFPRTLKDNNGYFSRPFEWD